MKPLFSKKIFQKFIYCEFPISLKRKEGFIQIAENGCFLKIKNEKVVSLVQANKEKSAPIGWTRQGDNFFTKNSIFVGRIFNSGNVPLKTLDGEINYKVKEPSRFCYNQKKDGTPDFDDVWIQSVESLKRNYHYLDVSNKGG